MDKIRIVTDSTGRSAGGIINQYKIKVIPLSLSSTARSIRFGGYQSRGILSRIDELQGVSDDFAADSGRIFGRL